MSKHKIGIFTIASKNYLAYVRVLLKSVAAIHPEYALYLCLADTVDDKFDPRAENFKVVQSDSIGIPHFDDMALRYGIMEFNTAVKPFMFQWLLDKTDLDSIIYLDPDIRVYSRFDRLEAVLASDVSVVLTPHITRPVEDGKNPDDYHMLQAGVFNLGFAAVNRCKEARGFLEWWGRRLETQAAVDIERNLFTDQRWCDLAPCFLDRLHVFKHPGYNAAYWNLTERTVRQVRGQWRVNDEPLAFFHFSGVGIGRENAVSKHQDRFTWKDLPDCKPLFDAYRLAVLQEGWEQTQGWQYAYAKTKDGLPIPTIVRQLYREVHPTSQDFASADVAEKLRELCNGTSNFVPFDSVSPISRLMEIIYRKRPDLQATFHLGSHEGRAGFRARYASIAGREYNLPSEFIPRMSSVEAKTPSSTATELTDEVLHPAPSRVSTFGRGPAVLAMTDPGVEDTAARANDAWGRLPISVRRLLAPVVTRMLAATPANEIRAVEEIQDSAPPTKPGEECNFEPPLTGRITALRSPAPIPQLLGSRCCITLLMHMIWSSSPDLQAAFDLNTPEGQAGFAGWLGAFTDNATSYRTTASTCPGANLIGYAHAEIGMGEHVRMSAAALESTTVQFGVVNFNAGVASRQMARLDHGKVICGNPFAANVFHVNADQMFVAYRHLGDRFFSNRYNIGYWAWELAKCPPESRFASKIMDEIWAPSRFIQRAFGEGADIPVEYMPLCVVLPEFERLGRQHFGLPGQAFVFLYTFDFLSFLDRKNPFAAIRAFKLAFPDRRSESCLVLKVINGKDESPLWANMIQLIDGDPRIVIINRTLNRSELLALFETSDCFLSLHRSEGFGRGPAEAMYLGKPVIVTNYSGNTDFTLADNSCLVDFELIPVEKGQYPCYQGQRWADADVEHAAWYMKKLHADSSYASDVGARGRAYIHENFSQHAIGAIYESRLKKLGLA
jgi:glycosyltransferase involved in cell wall biosynthesis